MFFFQALLALIAYDVLSKLAKFRTTYATVRNWRVSSKDGGPEAVERVCGAVNYACAWYPKQVLCLQRAFVTTYLLRRQGVAASMVLGAQHLPFKAHAWVEVGEHAINERSDVQLTYAIWDKC